MLQIYNFYMKNHPFLKFLWKKNQKRVIPLFFIGFILPCCLV